MRFRDRQDTLTLSYATQGGLCLVVCELRETIGFGVKILIENKAKEREWKMDKTLI
jgi:hypothetical protein